MFKPTVVYQCLFKDITSVVMVVVFLSFACIFGVVFCPDKTQKQSNAMEDRINFLLCHKTASSNSRSASFERPRSINTLSDHNTDLVVGLGIFIRSQCPRNHKSGLVPYSWKKP